MVPGDSCHIYGIWRSREVGEALKSSKVNVWKSAFMENGGFSAVLKLYCKFYWVL